MTGHRAFVRCGLSIAVVALAADVARAAEGPDTSSTPVLVAPNAARSASAGALLPQTLSPRVDAQRAAVAVTSGYDGARASATLVTTADIQLARPLGLRAGLTYLPNEAENVFKPHVGLTFQLLRQARHGLDGSLGAFYRMERFTEDEGQVQLVAAVARRFDALSTYVNLAYGQDPEGDDRDGEVRLAAQYEVSSAFLAGVDGRVRFDLFSNDARRATRGTTDLDFAVGPLAMLTSSRYAVVGQAGVSGVRLETLRTGLLATLGVASVF